MPFFKPRQYRIHYRELGEGPLFFILPGNTASSALHQDELAFFAGLGYHAVSVDFAGTGLSDRLPHPWPLDWFQRNAADCAALMDHLNVQKAIVSGTSGGAIVALWMAILFSDRVQAVIADSQGKFYPYGFTSDLFEDRAQRTSGQVSFWSTAHGQDWEAVVDADTELLLNIDEMNRERGGWEIHAGRLNEVRCPTLFSCSLTDHLIPGVGRQMLDMAAEVKDSWFFGLNSGSHPLMWSRPDEYRAAVKEFLIHIKRLGISVNLPPSY